MLRVLTQEEASVDAPGVGLEAGVPALEILEVSQVDPRIDRDVLERLASTFTFLAEDIAGFDERAMATTVRTTVPRGVLVPIGLRRSTERTEERPIRSRVEVQSIEP
jgi:hypothetical protein